MSVLLLLILSAVPTSSAYLRSGLAVPRQQQAANLAKKAEASTMKGVQFAAAAAIPAILPKKTDTSHEATYWYDPRIHSWGNIGLRGTIHATFAPLATAIIDRASYGGVDVRSLVKKSLPATSTVLDLCCGTGFSTSTGATGVDTSEAMLRVARLRRPDATFVQGNAETYGESFSHDVVTVMFATHEMPRAGRRRVLRNAARVARKRVVVVDISPDFEETLRTKPGQGAPFLAGEPYVLDYLKQMDADVASTALERSWRSERVMLLPKHVAMWTLDRASSLPQKAPYWSA